MELPKINIPPEQNKSEKQLSLQELKKIAAEQDRLILYHGGLADTATLDNIDLNRPGSKQNKPGKTYGGFYLTDETSLEWSKDYAREKGYLHGFLIKKEAKILETNKIIDRLSQEERDLAAQEYDLIKGKDILGRTQFVLLNKDVIEQISSDKLLQK